MALDIRALRSNAPFWSLRYHEEKRETLAMRQDTLEPPRLSVDRGAMLSAVVDGGYGYCATSDLSAAGLQKALDRATRWAQATKGKSVVKFDPARMGAPRRTRARTRRCAVSITRSRAASSRSSAPASSDPAGAWASKRSSY